MIEDRCECGRRSRRLEHGGRLQSLIFNGDGRWVTGAEIWDRLLFVPGVSLFQLQQKSRHQYDLLLMLENGSTLDETALSDELRHLLGEDAKVNQHIVSHLVTEASGKLQLVKSNTFEQFRAGASSQRPSVPIN